MTNQENSSNKTLNNLATREGFGIGLVEAAKKKPDVFGLCADLDSSMNLVSFKDRFPDRFVQVGVAEQNLIGVAAGLAIAGKIPFAASFAVFSPGRSWDQIKVSVAYSKLNVKIVGGHTGVVTGQDGATHHGLEDIALMQSIPLMKVVAPCDAEQARLATLALAEDDGPAYLRLTRPKRPTITPTNQFTLGKAQVLTQGSDATIIACGDMVHDALKAEKTLSAQGVSVRVINMHTIKPLDRAAIIQAANETKLIVTAEDHQVYGGMGSSVAQVICQELNHQITPEVLFDMVAVQDTFTESGPEDKLKKKYQLDDVAICKKIIKLLEHR